MMKFSTITSVFLILFGFYTASCQKAAGGDRWKLGPATLHMTLNGSTHLNLSIESGTDDYTPVVAYISDKDVTGPDGHSIPAHTLNIMGRALIDQVTGKSKTLTLTLYGVDMETGVYNLLEHDGLMSYSDASSGTIDWDGVMGWTAGNHEEGTGGTVTITKLGARSIPGFGIPIKGTFHIEAKGWELVDFNIKDEEKENGLLLGEFNWGLPE